VNTRSQVTRATGGTSQATSVPRATIVKGDKFRTPTGIWEVIETKPGGKVELFNKARASFQSRYHREVRLWERAS
jgi:hypothetical protein